MRRALTLAPLAVSLVAVLLAGLALRESRQRPDVPTAGEIQLAGVKALTSARDGMTPAQARGLLGQPTEVFRDNARALCWRYDTPYEVRMCWGPKRRSPWVSVQVPAARARS